MLTIVHMSTPAIAFDHVTKNFGDGHIRAVDGVSLQIAEGEFLAIVGGSGSGKTTLLRMANRLIDPDTGTIAIRGKNTQAADPITLRRSIGYVFQSAALFPHMSVAQNIGITPRLLNHPAAQIASRVDELMDMVQLDRAQYRDRMPIELSGGQRQRVGLARALAAKPDIVLMDEWLSVGDAAFNAKATERLDKVVQNSAILVLASHSKDLVERMCNRVLSFQHGRLLED